MTMRSCSCALALLVLGSPAEGMRQMNLALYRAVEARNEPVVLKLDPPHSLCPLCVELAPLWERLAEANERRVYTVSCAEQQEICIDRAVGGRRKLAASNHNRTLYSPPETLPSFQAWTGKEWVDYFRDFHGEGGERRLVHFVLTVLGIRWADDDAEDREQRMRLWHAAGLTLGGSVPPHLGNAADANDPTSASPPAVSSQPATQAAESSTPDEAEAVASTGVAAAPDEGEAVASTGVAAADRRTSWGEYVHVLTEATLPSLMDKDDFALLRIDPPGCRLCRSLDGLWALASQVLVEGNMPATVDFFHLDCGEQPRACATLQPQLAEADALAQGAPPVLAAWVGTTLEQYHGRLPKGPHDLSNPQVGSFMRMLFAAATHVRELLAESRRARAAGERPFNAAQLEDEAKYPLGWAEKAMLAHQQGAEVDSAEAADANSTNGCSAVEQPPRPELLRELGWWWPRVRARAEALGGRWLDVDGLAITIPNFLNASEVDHAVALGKSRQMNMFNFTERAELPVLRAISERVHEMIGIGAHPTGGELMLQVRWAHDYDVANPVHHDMNHRPRRVATAIIYLTGEEELGGGHTMFPCLEPSTGQGASSKAPAKDEASTAGAAAPETTPERTTPLDSRGGHIFPRGSLCGELIAGFEQGERHIYHRNSKYKEGHAQQWGVASGLDLQGYQMCRNGSGVRSMPGRGTALVFASSATPDATEPLPWMWHRGCHVESGWKPMLINFVQMRQPVYHTETLLAHAELWKSRGSG